MVVRSPFSTPLIETRAPAPAEVERAIHWLRLEQQLAEGTTEARLLSELAALERRRDDPSAAARDELAAANADPTLQEPLESLIALARARRSQKNVGRLLERLARVAKTPGERSRSGLELAAQARAEGRLGEARRALERCLDEVPDDLAAWLALEVIAGETGDLELLERATMGRAGLTETSALRALLLLDCAKLRRDAGDFEAALALTEQALDEGELHRGLTELEQLGADGGHPEIAQEAAIRLAGLCSQASDDEDLAERQRVPPNERSELAAARHLLRAAWWAARADNVDACRALTRQVRDLAPEPLTRVAHLRALEADDGDELSAWMRQELEEGVPPRFAAALWLDLMGLDLIASAQDEGDEDASVAALRAALEADPQALVAQALSLEMAEAGDDLDQIARALLATVESGRMESNVAAEIAATAAVLLATSTNESARKTARDALEVARARGLPQELVDRLSMLLGTLADDAGWQKQALDSRMNDGSTLPATGAELALQLVRLHLLAGDVEATRAAFSRLTPGDPPRKLLSAFLRGHAFEFFANPAGPLDPAALEPLLDALGDRIRDGAKLADVKLAFEIVAALREFEVDRADDAIARLRRLHETHPGNALVLGALSSFLERQDERAAANLWGRAAEGTDDPVVAAAWAIRAGLMHWSAGRRETALEHLSNADDRAPEATRGLIGWAKRIHRPEDRFVRRQLLEDDPSPTRFRTLELAALALGDDLSTFPDLLVEDDSASVRLLRGLLLSRLADDDRASVLERLPDGVASGTGHALAYTTARDAQERAQPGPDPFALAKRWAEEDPELEAALVFAAEAATTGDPAAEVQARLLLAERLSSPELAASAVLLADQCGLSEAELLEIDAVPLPLVRWARFERSSPTGGNDRAEILVDLARNDDGTPWGPTGKDHNARGALLSAAAFRYLNEGQAERALELFHGAVEAIPDDRATWEGLRSAAAALQRSEDEARACAELARLADDDQRAGALWARAGTLFDDVLGNGTAAEDAFTQALARDFGRDDAFERLFRIARARDDHSRMLELVEGRMSAIDDLDQIHELLFEKARLCREMERLGDAARAAETVLERTPDHLGCLALAGEAQLAQRRFDRAAEHLSAIAQHPEAPDPQRWVTAVTAAAVYEEHLHQPERAWEVLEELRQQGVMPPSEEAALEALERKARAAARASLWTSARDEFTTLSGARFTAEGRAEAARFVLAIQRDQLGDLAGARDAARSLLRYDAADVDGLDLVFREVFDPGETRELLEAARDALLERLREVPLDLDSMKQLSTVAQHLDDADLELLSLGSISLRQALPTHARESVRRLVESAPALPRSALPDEDRAALNEFDTSSPAGRTLEQLAPLLAPVLEPDLDALGISADDRVDAFSDSALLDELSFWAGQVGIDDCELYVGGHDHFGIVGLQLEVPTLIVGASVPSPLPPALRIVAVTELFALARNWGFALTRPKELRHVWEALRRVPEGDVASRVWSRLEEPGTLAQEVDRLDDDALESLITRIREGAARWAVLATGDPAAGTRVPGATDTPPTDEFLSDFVAFCINDAIRLRRGLGMTLR